MKRTLDIVISLCGLLFAVPILLPVIFFIWLQDRHSPFYIAERSGLDGKAFKMIKLRKLEKDKNLKNYLT